jgi:hypothetical protein
VLQSATVTSNGPESRSPGSVRASTSSRGLHGFDGSGHQQWYTSPSVTLSALITIGGYQPIVPAPPLNGPTTREVIHPP